VPTVSSPNCGQETTGDYRPWCKSPILKRRPIRRRKTLKRERTEAELVAEEQAKREAEEASKAKQAEEMAKKQAEEAQKQERKEAKLAAKEQAKRDPEEARKARQAEEMAKKEAEEVVGAGLYEGIVKLTVVSPVDLGQMRKLEEYLCQVQDLRLVLVGGSVDEGTTIVVSAEKPIPLIDVLREMSPVEQVFKEGNEIQIVLK